jgi:Na+/melibiose symporter-like transporter
MAPIMILVSPMTPRLSARFGANRVVAFGMCGIALGLLLFNGLSPRTPYWFVLVAIVPMVSGMALSMSPMTASIMSAVPARRAGAGSAMNDATRELGAALGIALMGSVAASRYTASLLHVTAHLPVSVRRQANVSLADALAAANSLGGAPGHALTVGAQHAFIDGIRLAVTFGAVLAVISAVIVYRNLPREAAHGTAVESGLSSAEATAELGLAGVEPAFAVAGDGNEEPKLTL